MFVSVRRIFLFSNESDELHRLIAAVPSSSTGLVYGRAALLGYTSGEYTCNGAYPKCPKNEVKR